MLNLDHNISRDEEVVATGKRKKKESERNTRNIESLGSEIRSVMSNLDPCSIIELNFCFLFFI